MRGVAGFMRHIEECRNVSLPGGRLALRLAGTPVGWMRPSLGEALAGYPEIASREDGMDLRTPAALPLIARDLSDRGFFRWRGEAFDVRATPSGPVLARLDRGGLPAFGVEAAGVHLNGLVRRAGGVFLWVARRAATKTLDPGKLDHIVAGGVPAGLTPLATLIKEAGEEAAIPPELAARSTYVATIGYAMERAEGLRRDRILCFDLDLPEDFVPRAVDGEVEDFELWPASRVLEAVRETDLFKFNVNLVLIDLFIRTGLVRGAEAATLRTALAAQTA